MKQIKAEACGWLNWDVPCTQLKTSDKFMITTLQKFAEPTNFAQGSLLAQVGPLQVHYTIHYCVLCSMYFTYAVATLLSGSIGTPFPPWHSVIIVVFSSEETCVRCVNAKRELSGCLKVDRGPVVYVSGHTIDET